MITLASTNKDGPVVRVFATKCTCIKHISQTTIARKKPDIMGEEIVTSKRRTRMRRRRRRKRKNVRFLSHGRRWLRK